MGNKNDNFLMGYTMNKKDILTSVPEFIYQKSSIF